MQNKGLITFGTLGAIILGFIAPLITWLNKEKLTPDELSVITNFFNFELSLLIVCVLINFIPLIGQLIGLILWVVNIVFSILAYKSANENKPFKALTIYPFIK